jgi:adenylate kinase family enzyme
MHKVVIFGNSGSGKSTLAREKASALGCVHLDLDTVAWEEDCNTPSRRPLSESQKLIEACLTHLESWVVEGCYSDLLELVIPNCDEVIFLNPGVEVCAANCCSRPWEMHKYDSKEEQDANLPMLLKWIEQYSQRKDEFSLRAHRRLFDCFNGAKHEYTSNERQQ